MSLTRILTEGVLVSIPFSLVVWASFLTRPRLWLHSLPADIQAMAPGKTLPERRLTALMGSILLTIFFGLPIALTARLDAETPGGLSFAQALTHLYGVWSVVNLWDLILIDWPYAYFVDPDRPPIPGTAGARGYKDYGFHFRSFLKASIFGLAVLVPASLLIARR